MKNLFSYFSLFLLISFTSCSDDSPKPEENSNLITKSTNATTLDPGELHNAIVNKYESYKDANGAITDLDSIALFVDDQLKAADLPAILSQVFQENPIYREKLYAIAEAKGNVNKINEIFSEMYAAKLSTEEQYIYSVNLMNLIKDKEGNIETYYTALASFEDEIQNDSEMDSTFKEQLLQSTTIAGSSHYFWYEEPGDPNLSQTQYAIRNEGRIVQIAGADTAGAITGIQSGAVATAGAIVPGWGAFVCLVAFAAVSSIAAS